MRVAGYEIDVSFPVHPSEARADICHAQCAGVEGDFFRHGNLIGQRHVVARSPVFSAPKGDAVKHF